MATQYDPGINPGAGVYNADMYPVEYDVEYSEEKRNRWSALGRLILVIPIMFIAWLLGGAASIDDQAMNSVPVGLQIQVAILAAGLPIAIALMILFRKKYPRWWFDWNLELTRFSARVFAYVLLLRDEYPSTDERQAVTLNIAYPDVEGQLNRVLPLFKWLLAIPHYIILIFLWLAALIVSFLAWVVIVITARHPRWMFNYVVGLERWSYRVIAYAFILSTDRYPPFRFRA